MGTSGLACTAMVRTIFGAEADEEIRKIPLLNDTLSRHISDLLGDIEKSITNKI